MTPEDVRAGRDLYESAKVAIAAHGPPTPEGRARGADMLGFGKDNPHGPLDPYQQIMALAALYNLGRWLERHADHLITAAESYWVPV